MNSKVSKRFKKKIKNFRQGMTAWRVHSYPIRDENYHGLGKNQEELDRKNGKGNSTCFHSGSTWMFIVCEQLCNVPEKTVLGWSNWKKGQGKRRLDSYKSLGSMWGSDGNRFFAKQQQAQAFMQEIVEGKHQDVVNENIHFHETMDAFDEFLQDQEGDDHGIYGDCSELEFA